MAAPARGRGAHVIRRAEPQDLPDVLALLREAQLPSEGVAEHFDTFFVGDEGGRIVGSAGLELHGDAALVRSLAVTADMRGTGIGGGVLRRALYEVRDCAAGVFALTTTAEAYLARFGFEPVPRGLVPQALFESRELQDACPASATVMKWRPL
jgi:N-acetylglutamate synthase-like GNAT family acetyltransferase